MSPLLFAIFGILLGAIAIKYLETRIAKPKGIVSGDTNKTHRNSRRLASLKNPPGSIYDCIMYATRLFEQKLVDEGVIGLDEMSLCDNRNCLNCVPTRRALTDKAKKDAWEQAQKRIKDGQRQKMLKAREESTKHCDKCDGWVPEHHVHGPADHAILNGRVVPRPYNVPPYAEIKTHFDPVALVDVIIWEWTYPNDTKKNFVKQNISNFNALPKHRPLVMEYSAGGINGGKITTGTLSLHSKGIDYF